MPSPKISHSEQQARSYRNLEVARQAASESSNYSSERTQEKLASEFRDRCGYDPYAWQLDVSEATLLGLDTIVIAKTGGGKTIPFMMPLMLDPKKKAVIISPLKILQAEHASRFRKAGISAIAVNGDAWSPKLYEELSASKYQGIFVGPEMCLRHPEFRKALSSAGFHDVSIIIIDEAHCILQWGGDFRPDYGELSKLRVFFPPHIPIFATTATLSPQALQDVRTSLGIDSSTSFFLNLGNDRPNITYSIQQINNVDDFSVLKPHLSRSINPSSPSDMTKSLIFMNPVVSTQVATCEIRLWFPKHLHKYIEYVHARRSPAARWRAMERLRKSDVIILVATEAAGMGADISDIEQVIQFGIPSSLTVWIQRAGRAGRNPVLQSRALLLYEKSMFERQRKRHKKRPLKKRQSQVLDTLQDISASEADPDNDLEVHDPKHGEDYEWRKKAEEPLRQWVQAEVCRRDILDDYFDNPPNRQPPTGPCCDNCDGVPIQQIEPLMLNTSFATTPPRPMDPNGQHSNVGTDTRPLNRVRDHLKRARASLETWRVKKKKTHYTPGPFTSTTLLPDSVLKTLASAAHIQTVDDMQKSVAWIFTPRHGDEILEVLRQVDYEEAEVRQDAENAKLAKQREAQEIKQLNVLKRQEEKRVRELKRQERQQEKENRKVERALERKQKEDQNMQRKRRRTTLAGTSIFNVTPSTPSNALAISDHLFEVSPMTNLSSPTGGILDFSTPLLSVTEPRPRPRPLFAKQRSLHPPIDRLSTLPMSPPLPSQMFADVSTSTGPPQYAA